MTIKGLHYVAKKRPDGTRKWYVYAWRGGPCIATRQGGGKPKLTSDDVRAYTSEIERLNSPDPRTLLSLIRQWRSQNPDRPSSPEWAALMPNTQKTWGSQLNRIEDRWADTPLALWNDPRMTPKVVKWRDSRAATPRAADLGVMVLRELLKFGRLRGRVTFNAAEGIPTLYRGGNRAEIVWVEEDFDRFAFHARKLDRAHMIDGLRLASVTGFRSADLVSVREGNVYEYAIVKRALKVNRGRRNVTRMPRIPELDAVLEELASRFRQPGVDTLLVNSRGEPWTADGFGGSFNRIRDAADIVHVDEETGERRRKHLHDLRGTFATNLIKAKLTDQEVAEVMGWGADRVANIRRVYVDQSHVVVAIGARLGGSAVNPVVN